VPFWFDLAERKILEERLDANPPQAARVYALASIAAYDGMVACYEAKYTYWAARPRQVDPAVRELFPSPAHPSYPSGHACRSAAVAGVLAHLFPRDAAQFKATAHEIGESRLWAGIHYRSDIVVGEVLGYTVAQAVVEHSHHDGAEARAGAMPPQPDPVTRAELLALKEARAEASALAVTLTLPQPVTAADLATLKESRADER
jgi:hypothetical protein